MKFDLKNVAFVTFLIALNCHLQASCFASHMKKATEVVHMNGGEFVAIMVALSL